MRRYADTISHKFCYYSLMRHKVDQIGKGKYSISGEYLGAFLEFVTECGVDASAILLDVGLAPESIIQQPQFVGSESFNRAIRSLLNQSPDPHHAYRFARRISELRHGTAGVIAQNSQTLREAMELGMRYVRPQIGNTNRLLVHTRKDTMTIMVSPRHPKVNDDYDHEIDSFTSIIMVLGTEMRGRRMSGTMGLPFSNELKVTHSDNGFSRYKAGLPPGLKITFNAPYVALVMEPEYLDTPLLAPSFELQAAALRHLEGLDADANISDRVRGVFQSHEPNVPDLDAVAEALHMSRATLKRKLKTSGSTFQDIKDSFRLRRASNLLRDTEATVDEIAAELSFSDASGFSKAFRRWTGLAPSEWRLAQQVSAKEV
ncbi:MAG: helix-turn-helix domain-containing protein [Haliea sp.]|nr:helix-turn-helix domain-containing protein [Haliea sp.]